MSPASISVRSLAVLLGLSRKRLHNTLSAERQRFGPRSYVHDGRNPRRVRMLSLIEVRVLCALLHRSVPDLAVPEFAARRVRGRKRIITPAHSSR